MPVILGWNIKINLLWNLCLMSFHWLYFCQYTITLWGVIGIPQSQLKDKIGKYRLNFEIIVARVDMLLRHIDVALCIQERKWINYSATAYIQRLRSAAIVVLALMANIMSAYLRGGGGGGGGGGFSPDFCENTILRYELAMMARTCTNNLRVHRYNIAHVRPWIKNGPQKPNSKARR